MNSRMQLALLLLTVAFPGLARSAPLADLTCPALFLNSTSEATGAAPHSLVQPTDKDRYFFRVVYAPEPTFDKDGYLHPVEFDGPETEVEQPVLLPLAHPDEWEVVARMFAFPKFKKRGQPAWLLKIKKEKVQALTNKPHVFFPLHGEFFGLVHKDAIDQKIQFIWHQTPVEPGKEDQPFPDWQPIALPTNP